MIRTVYVLGSNGDTLYRRTYTGDPESSGSCVPAFARACAILMRSLETPVAGRTYVMEQESSTWVFFFQESFVIVTEGNGEHVSALKRRTVSIGRALIPLVGRLAQSWDGDMSHLEAVGETIDQYALSDMETPDDSKITAIEAAIDRMLERHPVAYMGVLDSAGRMLVGNIPDDHLKRIRDHIESNPLSTSTTMVPTTIEVYAYPVELLKFGPLTLVAASYRGQSRIGSVRAVSDLADMLGSILERAGGSPGQ